MAVVVGQEKAVMLSLSAVYQVLQNIIFWIIDVAATLAANEFCDLYLETYVVGGSDMTFNAAMGLGRFLAVTVQPHIHAITHAH